MPWLMSHSTSRSRGSYEFLPDIFCPMDTYVLYRAECWHRSSVYGSLEHDPKNRSTDGEACQGRSSVDVLRWGYRDSVVRNSFLLTRSRPLAAFDTVSVY